MIMQSLVAPTPERCSVCPPRGLSRLGTARRRLGGAP